ncbi:MAG: hypothetical protein HS115_04015 [Spirochaetales bacterium]|nr:hypothetical protein [Spirochaetales bacterium]
MREMNLRIIHLAISVGLVIPLGVFYWLVSSGQVKPSLTEPLLFYVGMFIAVAAVIVSRLLPAALAGKLKLPGGGSVRATDLLAPYFQLKIIQWAVLEGAGLYQAVVYYLTGAEAALIIGGVLFVLLLVRRPSREDMRKMLGLPDSVQIID